MRVSHYLLANPKVTYKNIKPISYQLMFRAGMLQQTTPELIIWLPTGLKILGKLAAVVRTELARAGALEIQLPTRQLPEHEAVVFIKIAQQALRSYKQLPFLIYQLQCCDTVCNPVNTAPTRVDLNQAVYSFHFDQASLHTTHELMRATYAKILTRLLLSFQVIDKHAVDTPSCEFQALTPLNSTNQDPASLASNIIVAQLLQLDSRGLPEINLLDKNSEIINLCMGHYRFSLMQLLLAVAAQHHDARGFIWPENIAPFQVILLPLAYHKSHRVRELADNLYKELEAVGYEVMLDDRKERPGVLFANADLLGIPHRLVLNEHAIDNAQIEYQSRRSRQAINVELSAVLSYLSSRINSLPEA